MQSLFHSILSDLCFSRRIQFNTFNFHFTKKKKLFHLSSFLKLALHFTQFFPFYFKISTSNNFPSVTFIYSHNFSSSSSIRLIRNLLKGKNKLKKKNDPPHPHLSSVDRCQRADYSMERSGYERDEPRFGLIFRKSKTRSSTPSSYVYPVIPAGHCFRFDSIDEEEGGAIEKAVRTSMAAARDSGSTRGNPLARGIESIGKEESTNNRGSPPALYPQIEIRFSAEEQWTSLSLFLLEGSFMMDVRNEDRKRRFKIRIEMNSIGLKFASNLCVILSD